MLKHLLLITVFSVNVIAFGYDFEINVFSSFIAIHPEAKTVNPEAKKHCNEKYSAIASSKINWYKNGENNYSGATASLFLANFTANDLVYTVVYDSTGTWIATETRIAKKGSIYYYKGSYPSFDIIPDNVRSFMSKNDGEVNTSGKEKKCGAFMDAFKIEINPEHDYAKVLKDYTFYIVNSDAEAIVGSPHKLLPHTDSFFDFYLSYMK